MTNFNRCDRLYDKAYYVQNRPTKPLPQGTRNLVGFLLARAPSVQGVQKPSEVAAYVYPARASNPGPTAPSKSWNRRFTGQQGNELPGIGAVSISGG